MVYLQERVGRSAYGRVCRWEEADVLLVGVPWEGGVSFRRGTAQAPSLIRAVSSQIDYYRSDCPFLERAGLFWVEPEEQFQAGVSVDEAYEAQVLPYVESWAEAAVAAHKPLGLIGGDHSVPLGLHRVLQTLEPGYGLLHIDAHADLRISYDGLRYSHATILHHLTQFRGIERIVMVGIRDWAREEAEYAQRLYPRLVTYEMRRLAQATHLGRSWLETTSEIVSLLPERVYVSIDVDALDVGYVPHTGTPVPGGLRYEELFFLLEAVRRSGRQIVAFDVCETGGQELDAIVSAHLIYRLCGIVLCAGGER
ncbi:MAG: arginase family protein [Bacteroidia bacterium]|nr:arginase family protein [Bacteroidia bacterium]